MEFKFNRALKGVQKTKITKYTVVENENGGYIQLLLDTPERSGYKLNIFESNLDYFGNNLARIAELDDVEDIRDILQHLIDNETEFDLEFGIVNTAKDGRIFRNGIAFPDTVQQQVVSNIEEAKQLTFEEADI